MVLHPLKFFKSGIQRLSPIARKQMLNFSSTSAVNTGEPCKQEEPVLLQSLSGGKALITLNRPKTLNTLNTDMVTKMRQELLRWMENKYLIAIEGSGEKAFCAGGDVVAVTKDKTGEVGKKFFTEEYKLDALIASFKIPVIAFLNGIVMGGGVGISIYGKYRVATETTMFAMPETQIGFFPDVGVSQRLAHMPDNLGYFLGLTGYRLKGYDLIHAGIATHFCSQSNLNDLKKTLLHDFAKSICSCPEEILNDFQDKSIKNLKEKESTNFRLKEHIPAIKNWFGGGTMEDIMRKIGEDKSKFAVETAECLKRMSPLSLKVTLKQIRDAREMSLFDVFNMDYRIAVRMMESGDFAEGVRALLIDKDKKPKWKHSDLSKVTDNEVQNFFTPLPEGAELSLPDSLYK